MASTLIATSEHPVHQATYRSVPDRWYDVTLAQFETVWKMGTDVGWTGDEVYRHSQHIGVAETETSVYACEIGEYDGWECG
jgi:hypothetical protein